MDLRFSLSGDQFLPSVPKRKCLLLFGAESSWKVSLFRLLVKLYLCLKARIERKAVKVFYLSLSSSVEKRSCKRGQSSYRLRSPFAAAILSFASQAHQHQSWCIFHKCVTYVGNGMPKSPAILVRDILATQPLNISKMGLSEMLQCTFFLGKESISSSGSAPADDVWVTFFCRYSIIL